MFDTNIFKKVEKIISFQGRFKIAPITTTQFLLQILLHHRFATIMFLLCHNGFADKLIKKVT